MDDDGAMIAMAALAVGLVLVLGIGVFLVIRDTVRKRGRWGINLQPVQCPECGTSAPVIRRPRNWRQFLWGGCTCDECGTEYDKWGQKVRGPDDEPGAATDGGDMRR